VLDILAKMLPELAGRIAEPIGKIQKVSVVDTGSGKGAGRMAEYVTELMTSSNEMLGTVAGVDLNRLAQRLTGSGPVEPPSLAQGDGAPEETPDAS
jgi:flotillin